MSTIHLANPPHAAAGQSFTSGGVLGIAIAVFALPVILIEYDVLQFTGGIFTYPVDDTFIHLAIAKNLATHNVWGISPHEFVSASSSVLYPLLLALMIKVAGAHAILPFIVNMLAAIAFIGSVHRWLAIQGVGATDRLMILLVVIVLIPLPVIAMSGMEHTLQLLICFLFITRFSKEVGQQAAHSMSEGQWSLSWLVYTYGLLLTAIRYEGIMLVGIACLTLLVRQQWLPALRLGLLSFLPILVFGFYSVYHGSYFIPNSVLLKSGAPPLTPEGLWQFFSTDMFDKLSFSTVGYNTVATQRMLFILLFSYLLFRHNIRKDIPYSYLLILLTGATLLHILLTGRGRFPRYEAYLIGNGLVIVGALFARYGREIIHDISRRATWVAVFIALFLVIPVLMRSLDALSMVDRASINIYQQQYQMGKFMGKYYHDTPIAFNDIGAVSYFTQGKNLDLWGLGNLEVARSMKNYYYTPDFLDQLSQQDSVQVAVVFERYFPPQLLTRWDKVASWKITSGNVICADDSVAFYAVKREARGSLTSNLRNFQPSLPAGVSVLYY